MSVRAFGVKNLRCLKDSGLLRLKPITLLVGKNSSGKSTYLRAFPLFRQSLETPRSSPFLWFHPGYVDFGTLQEAVRRGADPREVTFEIEIDIPPEAYITLPNTPVKVALSLLDDAGTVRVSRIEVEAGELRARARFDPTGKLTELVVGPPGAAGPFSALPEIPVFQSGPASWLPTLSGRETGVSYVRHVVEDRSQWDLRSDLDEWTPPSVGALPIECATLARTMPFVLQAADLIVGDFMSGVSYLAPIRSEGARFHRLMDLGIEEIDPRGENLAMLLKSLSKEEVQSLGDFTKAHLGFSPSLQIQGMQAEIRISSPGIEGGVNLVDVGFGYSQVLPLATMVWSACVRRSPGKRRRPTLLALEQPELHMHPAFQGQLAAMLADASRQSRSVNGGVPMIIETHSQALVNGLGFLIEEKKLTHEEVQVVLFERDEETGQADVRVVNYDEDGHLIDWPYGFFASGAGD